MMNQLHSWMKEFGGAEEYTEKVYLWLKGLIEKQGEQKPADWLQELHCKLDSLSKEDFEKVWAKYAQKEEPVEWSEEDENCLGDALLAIQQAKTIAKDENDMDTLWCVERWLKSLKDRYTWKLSEERIAL